MQITPSDSGKAMLMEEFSRKSRKQVIKELFPPLKKKNTSSGEVYRENLAQL